MRANLVRERNEPVRDLPLEVVGEPLRDRDDHQRSGEHDHADDHQRGEHAHPKAGFAAPVLQPSEHGREGTPRCIER